MPLLHVQLADGTRSRWPTAYPALPAEVASLYAPPDTRDMLSDPDVEMLARQVDRLHPRGRAWNTDEAQAEFGSKVQHGVWRLIAAGLREFYLFIERVYRSGFPGQAGVDALDDWEDQHGLPEACFGSSDDPAIRRRTIQAARLSTEGMSRFEALRLLRRAGAPETTAIVERRGFECGWSELGVDGLESEGSTHSFYVSGAGTESWLECGGNTLSTALGQLSSDAALCALERARHAHTKAVYEPTGF